MTSVKLIMCFRVGLFIVSTFMDRQGLDPIFCAYWFLLSVILSFFCYGSTQMIKLPTHQLLLHAIRIVSYGCDLGVIDDFLRHAMTDCNQESLVAGVLLARQSCLEGQHVFKSYEDWFQVTCFSVDQLQHAKDWPLLTG